MPEWLHDIFLGYGDPAAAQPANMPNQLRTVDFKDTLFDAQHLSESFPGREVSTVLVDERCARRRIRRSIAFPRTAFGRRRGTGPLVVESYVLPDPGPYPRTSPI